MARVGLGEVPPVLPPGPVRRVLGFRRLSIAALAAVRRSLDDDQFRQRVAEAAPPAGTWDRASELLVLRPDGWEDELADLRQAADRADRVAGDERAEHDARRRLRVVEEARAELAAIADALRTELADTQSELAEARRARRDAEAAVASLDQQLSLARRQHDEADRRAARAELAAAAARREAEADLADVQVGGSDPGAASEQVPSVAARRIGHARRASGDPARRLPLELPPGRFAEEDATAWYLVRASGAVLLVDGYNASLQRWATAPISEQRSRLVDGVSGLAARVSLEIEVVFDGRGAGGVETRAVPRTGVRISFTPEDMEADDAIIDRVAALPATRPVIVASDDRAVQRRAAALGANVITQRQLFSLLGLGAGPD